MATTSKASYTPEQTKELLDLWQNGKGGLSIQELALKLSRNVKSIATKLSREGCYTSPAKTAKPVVKKDTLADVIGELCGMDGIEIDSMTKPNRSALQKVIAKLQNSENSVNENNSKSDEKGNNSSKI